MVRRIRRQKFQAWWDAKRSGWLERGSALAMLAGYDRKEKYARIYRATEDRYVRNLNRGPGYRPWHATYLHRQYRLKRKGRK